ncbi:Prephenate dehydratase family protein [Candida albicans]|uniref:prephenate dehydratase n=1 Tax=Candida albicans TaxID=5476 RepID=A0A8H6F722_CANAX|nr:Prephenate dehydratase family protein [Candida albicans]
MTIKVAFLGPEGTYTHQALIQQFVPFENSTNGQVVFTYDLLRDWYFQTSTPPKFRIIAEQFVSIHHNLLTNASKIEDIKTIYSHPQVWTQVNKFLQSLPQQITKIDVGSTSKAAEIVSQDTITTSGSSSAAISSYMSSELYKLPILKEGIEDNQSNTTRFLILGYDSPISPPPPPASNNDDDNSKRNTTIVSSIMFTLNHDDPGALCDVLVKFKEYGITLTSINSRPANLKPWQYVFFVEMIGDIHQEGLVEKIKEPCLELVILGVFQRSWRYNNNSNDQ